MLYSDWLKAPLIFYWLGGLVFLWLVLLSFFLIKYILHYRMLVKKTGKKNLKSILDEILHTVEQNQKNIFSIEKECEGLEKEGLKHLQKVGFLRFNPFSDTGGDQSFILTILNGKGDGMLLSSLHSRGTTRLYAKEIEQGKSKTFGLSKEEEQVVQKLTKKVNKKSKE